MRPKPPVAARPNDSGFASPLPLAGEVGARRGVGEFSQHGQRDSRREPAPQPSPASGRGSAVSSWTQLELISSTMSDLYEDLLSPLPPEHSRLERFLLVALGVVLSYTMLAYLVLPLIWTHYEHQKGLENLPMVTRTGQGIPCDPINVGLVGDQKDMVCAMHEAGWYPADPITLRSSIEIVGSVLLDRPYRDAPVSNLYYLGRREDLAFEKPIGASADRRNHLRYW